MQPFPFGRYAKDAPPVHEAFHYSPFRLRVSQYLDHATFGDVTPEDVTVLEAGEFSYDLSSGEQGKVVMKNCRGDIAYNPLFNLILNERVRNGVIRSIGQVEDQGSQNTIIRIESKTTAPCLDSTR